MSNIVKVSVHENGHIKDFNTANCTIDFDLDLLELKPSNAYMYVDGEWIDNPAYTEPTAMVTCSHCNGTGLVNE